MANFPGLQMTAAGRDLQAKAQTGVPLNFSRVAIGDGENPVDYEPLVSLVSEKKSLDLAGFELLGDGTSKLKVLLTNEEVVEGFFIREIGVFAIDPDTSTEVLYSYSNADQYIDYLPAFGGTTIVEMTFDLITVVGNATTVTATINDYLVHATKADVDELRPHVLPPGGIVGQQIRKASNAEGDHEWFDPAEGVQIRINSVTEQRTAVQGQTAFALMKTLTNGLAVYVNGLRVPNEDWSANGGSQVIFDAALNEGDKVQFVNNEEVGTATLARVSLDGPDLVYQGTSNSYTITDFDRFSNYIVSTNVGSVSHSNGVITLDIPAQAESNDGVVLTVQRNEGSMSFNIALGDQAVAQPQITAPNHGATDITETPTISASGFQTYPAGADSQASATWRIATDTGMTNVIWQSVNDTVNLTSIKVPKGVLQESTVYYCDVLQTGQVIGDSIRSSVISFETTDRFVEVLRPSITSPAHNSVDLLDSPKLVASAYQTYPSNIDPQEAAIWRIATDPAMSNVVWTYRNETAPFNEVVVPSGILQTSETYYADVTYEGASIGLSEPSVLVAFTMADQFVPSIIGESFGAGYFAGIIDSGTERYAIIVAPKSSGETWVAFKNDTTSDVGHDSFWDGQSNSAALNDSQHPAIQFCRQLNIGGKNDWYLGAADELEVVYRNFKPSTQSNRTSEKRIGRGNTYSGLNTNSDPEGAEYTTFDPTQTEVEIFKRGGAEAFEETNYWTSSHYSSSGAYALVQGFHNGYQGGAEKTYPAYVRAIRKVPIN